MQTLLCKEEAAMNTSSSHLSLILQSNLKLNKSEGTRHSCLAQVLCSLATGPRLTQTSSKYLKQNISNSQQFANFPLKSFMQIRRRFFKLKSFRSLTIFNIFGQPRLSYFNYFPNFHKHNCQQILELVSFSI